VEDVEAATPWATGSRVRHCRAHLMKRHPGPLLGRGRAVLRVLSTARARRVLVGPLHGRPGLAPYYSAAEKPHWRMHGPTSRARTLWHIPYLLANSQQTVPVGLKVQIAGID
jgi:hypothetical protein